MKKTLKKKTKPKPDTLTFKLLAGDKAAIQAKADKWTDGNMSAWCLYASLNCVPLAKDLTNEKA